MKLLPIPEGMLEIDSLGRINLIKTQGIDAGGTIVLREMLKGLEGHRTLISVKYEETAMLEPVLGVEEVG